MGPCPFQLAWCGVNHHGVAPFACFGSDSASRRQSLMTKLTVTYQTPGALKPRAGKPRTQSAKPIHQIAESIEAFGFTNPILIDDAGGVIAGHGRLAAAKLLGLARGADHQAVVSEGSLRWSHGLKGHLIPLVGKVFAVLDGAHPSIASCAWRLWC